MAWYYVDNNVQQGPVSAEEIKHLVSTGKITDQTYVWREDLDNWKFFSEVRSQFDFSSSNIQPSYDPNISVKVKCISCEQLFPKEECLELSDSRLVCAICKPKVIQQMKEGVTVAGHFTYAGFWKRFAAKLIDNIILMAVNFPLTFALGMFLPQQTGEINAAFFISQGVIILLSTVIGAFYNAFLVGKYGATWGKMALNLRVIRPDGSSLSYGRATGRYFSEILSSLTLLIGYLMAAFDSEKRALHDRVSDTRVIVRTP